MKKLSPESIRQRFFLNKKEFTEKELKFLTEVDQLNHLAYVAVTSEGESYSLAGVIRAIRSETNPAHAEIGIVVVDTFHGHGLGLRLMNEIAQKAQLVGITHFIGEYHVSNLKMIKLLKKFMLGRGALSLKHIHDDVTHFEAALK